MHRTVLQTPASFPHCPQVAASKFPGGVAKPNAGAGRASRKPPAATPASLLQTVADLAVQTQLKDTLLSIANQECTTVKGMPFY